MKVLSKSRFKTGLSCPNKLYFTGNKSYKNKEDDNTFLASLAEGGFQVEALHVCHILEDILSMLPMEHTRKHTIKRSSY